MLSPTTREANLLRHRHNILTQANQIVRDAGLSTSLRPISSHDMLSPRRFLASELSAWPDPILALTRIVAPTHMCRRSLQWILHGAASVYALSSALVVCHMNDTQQQQPLLQSWNPPKVVDNALLLGHTSVITTVAVSHDYQWLASADATNVLRLWDLSSRKCVLTQPTTLTTRLTCLSFSHAAHYVACVGLDTYRRTQVAIYDASTCTSRLDMDTNAHVHSHKLVLWTKHTCDMSIETLVFVPASLASPLTAFVSCGHENIWCWHLDDKHTVPRCNRATVVLEQYGRDTVFHDVAFNDRLCTQRIAYIASSKGTVLLVDIDTQALVCVYRLHDDSITSIAISHNMCVTASHDTYVRVWPLDFSDFYLEAQHDGAVACARISPDGTRVLVATCTGATGILHLSSTMETTSERDTNVPYFTYQQADTTPVIAMVALPHTHRSLVAVACKAGTLRIVDAASGDQYCTLTLDVQDLVTSVAAIMSLTHGLVIAAGYVSGYTRIFTVRSMHEYRVLYALPPPRKTCLIHDIVYNHDGSKLYTVCQDQHLCLYDVTHEYGLLASTRQPETETSSSASPTPSTRSTTRLYITRDGRYIATLHPMRDRILLLDASTLCLLHTLSPPPPIVASTGSLHHHVVDNTNRCHETDKTPLILLTHIVDAWQAHALVAISSSDRIYVFDLDETSASFGRAIHSTPMLGQRGITAWTLSPNRQYLATGGHDGTLRVWHMDDAHFKSTRMHQSFTIAMDTGPVTHVVFSSNGAHVIATTKGSLALSLYCVRGNTSLSLCEMKDDDDDNNNKKNKNDSNTNETIETSVEDHKEHENENNVAPSTFDLDLDLPLVISPTLPSPSLLTHIKSPCPEIVTYQVLPKTLLPDKVKAWITTSLSYSPRLSTLR